MKTKGKIFEHPDCVPVNPSPEYCQPCNPRALVGYAAIRRGDAARRPGVGLALQTYACRRYSQQAHRRRLEAVFTDTPGSGRQGLRRLLAHLAICHNQTVLVHRLDRLPSGAAGRIALTGTHIQPVSGERLPHCQSEFFADMTKLTHELRRKR